MLFFVTTSANGQNTAQNLVERKAHGAFFQKV
jgi:hypothetical protein